MATDADITVATDIQLGFRRNRFPTVQLACAAVEGQALGMAVLVHQENRPELGC
jgi:hypothetical protein